MLAYFVYCRISAQKQGNPGPGLEARRGADLLARCRADVQARENSEWEEEPMAASADSDRCGAGRWWDDGHCQVRPAES